MCTSLGSTFAWVGAILVNIGFISLIAWGQSTLWPLGFALSALYTAFLFGLATWLDARHHPTLLPTDETEAQEQTTGAHPTVFVSVLYALGVISLGVTGYFLPQNIFSCNNHDYDYRDRNVPKWTTDIKCLPSQEVRKWAKQYSYDDDWEFDYDADQSTFAYIPTTETTIFSGSSGDNAMEKQVVWVINPQLGNFVPQKHGKMKGPNEFTSVSNHTACFVARDKNSDDSLVQCSDGQTFRPVIGQHRKQLYNPSHLFASEGLLWFKTHSARRREDGSLIYSLEPDVMNLTLHSKLQAPDPSKPSSCDSSTTTRQRAIAAFFVTALPITIVSVLLWKKKQISSMGFTYYLGLTLLYVTLYIPFDPDMEHFDMALKWWLTVTGGAWTLLLSYALLAKTSYPKGPLEWGLNVGGLAFYVGINQVVFGSWGDRDTLWRWIVINILAYIPLTLLGLVTDALFLAFLGALGFFWDAGRFAQYIGDRVTSSVRVPVAFIIFALAGIAIAVMGYQLTKYQDALKEKVTSVLQPEDDTSGHASIQRAVPHHNDNAV